MQVRFERGDGFVTTELPDDTDVFIAGETVPDPPHLGADELIEATRAAIRAPLGAAPLAQQAGPGSRVVIVFPRQGEGRRPADGAGPRRCRSRR